MSVRLLASGTPEQEMLVGTAIRFIEDTLPLPGVRALADSGSGAGPAYTAAAGSLGWFGLLVDEGHGGGSVSGNGVSGNGLLDAAAVAAERGAALQPGPFVGTNLVAHALSSAGTPASAPLPSGESHAELLRRLVEGRATAVWVAGAVGGLTPGAGEITLRHDRGTAVAAVAADAGGPAQAGAAHYVLDGEVRHVADALDCEILLVSGHGPDGLTQVLVPVRAAGVEVRRLAGLDLTRQTCAVRLRGVRVPAGAVVGVPGVATEELFARQARIAAVLSAAESVGAMHGDFELAVEYARARIAFGRPIGSFQAIKHLLADTSLALEMAKGLVAAAAEALGSGAPDGAELAHAAKAFVAEHSITLTHSCFQVFGGVGYTWEHDHHLFMRRLAADAEAFGSADWHRARLGERIGVG
ncbi:acyl-CoA dehydrogenase [Frankia sp. EI5c]|uniref:acyl-CoA dehydrogenase family protein n=1 Tax=Frankia sp. EI5c TaxID=683316 RepID=UPI0007C377D2|nr:acyl-CoA dehydrogenase [Frankia sp. EI5c]OAA27832.1 acyl-CoA dehydrogenase [Frankia sp. EI5c]